MTKKVIWSVVLTLLLIVTVRDIVPLSSQSNIASDGFASDQSLWVTIPASIVSMMGSILGAFLLVVVCTYVIYMPFYILHKRSWQTQKVIATAIGGLLLAINLSGVVRPSLAPAYPEVMSLIEKVCTGFVARLFYFSMQGAIYVIGSLILISIINKYEKKSEAAGS